MKKIFTPVIIILCACFSQTYAQETCTSPDELGTINALECSDIGTAAFTPTTFTATLGTSHNPPPSGAMPVCEGSYSTSGNTTEETWYHGTLDGVTSGMNFNINVTGSGANDNIDMAIYSSPPGVGCSNLTLESCGPIIVKSGPDLLIQPFSVDGLTPGDEVYIVFWSKGDRAFNLNMEMYPYGSPPDNDLCANPTTESGQGCNLGANPDIFNTPTPQSVTCDGGTWSSNENTVFFEFVASELTGQIEIENVLCNDGTAGTAQFGVWSSCADLGTYGSEFHGCGVGAGSIILANLTIGDTYILAVDGFAGDNCIWDFVVDGVILSAKIDGFEGKHISSNGMHHNEIKWNASNYQESEGFVVERSKDGMKFSPVSGMLSPSDKNTFIDEDASNSVNYYRIKEINIDGSKRVSQSISLMTNDHGIHLEETFVVDNQLFLTYDLQKSSDLQLYIYGINGGLVYSQNLFVERGIEQTMPLLSTDNLAKGVYVLNVKEHGTSSSLKFIVQ